MRAEGRFQPSGFGALFVSEGQMSGPWQGIVHAHSNNSFDASMSYAELRDFFSARGLHFACMTEHIEELTQADIDRIVDGCRSHSDERFLFVPGIEMDCFVIYFLGVDHVRVDFADNRSIFESLHRAASLCIFSHPIKAGYRYPDWLIERCDGVEVLNCKHDGTHYLRPQSERLYRRIRTRRPGAVALAGLDFHGPRGYASIRLRLTAAGPLTEQHVLQSLKGGAFEIVKDGVPMRSFGTFKRSMLQARIHLMDASHGVHRMITRAGIPVPRGIKRAIRGIMEGRQ